MKNIYLTIFLLTSVLLTASAQYELVNDGGAVTIQNGGEVFIKGELINTNNSSFTSTITNNGLIELTGDYTNNATYTFSADPAHQRLIRFKNTGLVASNRTQDANGTLNFYNVEVDNNREVLIVAGKGTGGAGGVVMNNNVTIEGTLNFANLSSKIDANGFDIYIANDDPTAITNYTESKYIQMDGTANGGSLTRDVLSGNSYAFPIGTYNEAYVGMTVDFNNAPADEPVTAVFIDNADNGIISPLFRQYSTGPNCYNNNPQWVELSSMIENFGYWQIDAADSPDWNYDMTVNSATSTDPVGESFSTFKNIDPATGDAYTFFKLLRTSDANTINSSFNWYSDIPTSGDICAVGPTIPGLSAYNITGFSEFGVAGNSTVGLPIELLYLRADDIDNEYIKVDWATAVEIDNMGFELERRTDNTNFEKIAWIDGHGSTAEEQYYSYNDHDVVPNTLYYYRLKQIDFDGEYEHTYVVTAMITEGHVFTISEFIPNPAIQQSSLIVNTSIDKELDITIYNTLGQIITDKQINVAPGSNKIDFPLDNVADGNYHAIIRVDNEVFNKKLIITKY